MFQNKSRQIRTLKAVVTTGSVYYTGIPANPIKRADGEFALAGGQSETLALQVHPEEYMDQVWSLVPIEVCSLFIISLIRQWASDSLHMTQSENSLLSR